MTVAVVAVVALVAYPLTIVLAVVGAVVVAATRWRALLATVRSPRAVLVGRVVAVSVLLVALPQALTSIADIAVASCPDRRSTGPPRRRRGTPPASRAGPDVFGLDALDVLLEPTRRRPGVSPVSAA